ncbi:ArsR/SmtB family transcription factor [Calothrix sp. NIES-3974]|uniref:ArsR/SmtB family transcription factor n=1 Tax=Calothrix sp. NIES-3974 TaxID=2005462 RepID=UPI000B5E40FA|nr:metalloregulator ArsR/SmtB family transcription factor [Calothrix sp. NIES-3974]BAZ04120.1 ArsR family transcriptional regulator [Calothrix sp. NIES-3974]
MSITHTQKLEKVIVGFQALSDPLRVSVVELLQKREMCVCDLCDILGVSQSKLSFHLKNLKEAELVHARQEGRWIYYSLNLAQFAFLQDYLAQFSLSPSAIIPAPKCCE